MIGLDNWIIAAVAMAIVVEALLPHLVGWRVHYRPRHTAASTVVAVGFVAATAFAGVVLAGLFTEVHRLRAFDVPPAWWGYLLGFVVWDFLRYWRHRADHALRWLWATHVVHHSTKELNFLASFRQGWTDLVSGGWIVAIPFVWIGFDPKVIGVVITSQFLYDIWLHGEWIPKLGPLEAVLVTPSNHRVHHGVNDRYFNWNFGTVFIVWDRVFGTYAREDRSDPPQYGLRGPDPGYDPLRIAFHEWAAMFRDMWCQWRSKKGPPRRCKKGPLGGCGLVPVVHGRAPRATRRALHRLTRRRAREGPVGPRGQAWAGWSVQLAVGV